jgi:hypothetical protein
MKLFAMLATLPFLAVAKSVPNSCTVTTWGDIEFESWGKATVNLGAPTDAHITGLQIPGIKYNFANCVAENNVAIKAYEYSAYGGSCNMNKPITSVTFNKNSFVDKPYDSKTELTTGIQVTGPHLAALQTSDGKADATNTVEICLKFTIAHNDRELMFSEHLLTIKYQPKLAFNGATAASLTVERADAEEIGQVGKVKGDLTAFRCNENLEAYAYAEPIINQHNALVRICVHGQAAEVQCDKFWDATLEQDVSKKRGAELENRVSKGAINSAFAGMTEIAGMQDVGPVKARKKGCVLTVMLSSDYFQSKTPGKVEITGEVFMSFSASAPKVYRRLGDGRRLQDAASGEKAASFEIDVPVGETPNSNTAARTSFIAAAGLVMTAAAQCIV